MKFPSLEEFLYDLKNAIAIIAAYAISCLTIEIISNVAMTVYTCMPPMKMAIGECYTTFFHFDIIVVYMFLALMLIFFLFIFPLYGILSTLAWKRNYRNLKHFLLIGLILAICTHFLFIYLLDPQKETDADKKLTAYLGSAVYSSPIVFASAIHWWMRTKIKFFIKKTDVL